MSAAEFGRTHSIGIERSNPVAAVAAMERAVVASVELVHAPGAVAAVTHAPTVEVARPSRRRTLGIGLGMGAAVIVAVIVIAALGSSPNERRDARSAPTADLVHVVSAPAAVEAAPPRAAPAEPLPAAPPPAVPAKAVPPPAAAPAPARSATPAAATGAPARAEPTPVRPALAADPAPAARPSATREPAHPARPASPPRPAPARPLTYDPDALFLPKQ
jgi:hypothetical protein